jgi:MFS family permease
MTATEPSVVHARAGTYAGLFTLTLATLVYEIALTRIFSVVMWYHFAFVAISVALFGLTIGALIVHHFPDRFPASAARRQLGWCSLLFSASILPCLLIQLSIKFIPELNLAGLWSVLMTCSVVSIPFVFSGIAVTIALTRFPRRVNRLYAADLIGAAVGCALVVWLLNRLDGPSVIIVVGALGAIGALFFVLDASIKWAPWLAAFLAVALATLAVVNGYMSKDGNALVKVNWVKGQRDGSHLNVTWNAFSRLTVDGHPSAPTGITIDGTAGTALLPFDGNPASASWRRDDFTSLVHYVRPNADTAVIGSGGGADVLSSIAFRDRSTTGIEINPGILHLANGVYGHYTGHLDRVPHVRFVNDEARSYLTRNNKRFDIIQISLIDTWAAESAGAYALSENSLYTTHAWQVYFDRLKTGGVLSVTRFYTFPGSGKPLEVYRTAALAAQVLHDRGVKNPRAHLLIYHGPRLSVGVELGTVLVSPHGFTQQELATVAATASRLGFTPVLTPTVVTDPRFAALASPGGPGPGVRGIAEDISPPTDDHPFFFQMANLHTVLSGSGLQDNFATRPVFVLLLLAIAIVLLALGFILLPLLVTTKRGDHRGMGPFYLYFAGIGLGFLLVELSQLQRLSIFLGNPTSGLTVVLFSVLLFSGLGSMLTERFVRVDHPRSVFVPLLVLLAVIVAFGAATPFIIRQFESATTPVRIAVSIGILAPISLPMGMPFVIGMRAATSRRGTPTAFLWGINGATSVCASVVGILIAIWFRISVAFWLGAAAYALAGLAMVVILRGLRRDAAGEPRAVALAPDSAQQPAGV